ncbi:MAG: hypothetical protein JWN84_3623 [Nocardioides sp.]|nr:hypothetical protein [Nocardioides sp.]
MSTDLSASGTPGATAGSRARRAWRGLVVENVVVVVVFALAGAGAGWFWERWATPAAGVVLEGAWRLGFRVEGDFLTGDSTSFQRAFGVIGTYAVVCAVVGLVLGVLAALLCRRSELVTLVAVLLGSVVAAFVCYRVGLALGPPDPAVAARTAENGTVLVGDLSIDRRSPFVVLPLVALLSLASTYFLTTSASAGAAGARRIDLPTQA